jgi:arabinose-5-phosphate isomerase
MLAILPALKRLGVSIVLLTGNPKSTLASQCEVVLDVSVAEEACPMNLAPTASTTAALAMGDALAMALLDRRGLRPEDYAALHPGGMLGWRALFRVADLMHGGDTIPMVAEDADLRRVVEEMTRERSRSVAAGETPHACGMTTVVDPAGRLVGIITDGDLRRLHLRGGSFDAVRAGDVATRTPRTIGADDLAAKALETMEGTITSLVVVDETGRPRGVIHMHDILRAKII